CDAFHAADVAGSALQLDLDGAIPQIERAAHFMLCAIVFTEVSARGIHVDRGFGALGTVVVGERAPERNALRLRPQVPTRRFDEADGARALAVAARLLVRHRGARAGRPVDEPGAVG